MARPNPKLPALSPQDIHRFHQKVKHRQANECWLWQSHIMNGGYGVFSVGNKTLKAHRVAYFISRNTDPGTSLVCHTCDNPPCCNPAHLFLGSYADNRADCDAKGRTGRATGEKNGTRTKPDRIARGEKQGHAKLTAEQVLAIRAEYQDGGISQRELGIKFNVSRSAIKLIVANINWRHV